MAEKLRAEQITKTFYANNGKDAVQTLAGIDIWADEGEFVSIIGPSGCGKSTLFNILVGLIAADSGQIVLDGEQADSLLGRIAYMQQEDLLMPWRNLLDNVALPLQLKGMSKREARSTAARELSRFGLEGFEKRWPSELSGGMRQRAALLRTFLSGRDVMLLDEPFGALDALTRREMQNWLLEVWSQKRKTVLFVTHDIEEAIYLSDRIYVMSPRPGRIRTCLTVELPRPRTLETALSAPFVELRGELLSALADNDSFAEQSTTSSES